jgi:cystathionine beta-lyase
VLNTRSLVLDFMTQRAHVLFDDGAWFGRGGTGHIRLNVATPRRVLMRALQQIHDAVSALG